MRTFNFVLLIMLFVTVTGICQTAAWLPAIDSAGEFEAISVQDTSRADLERTAKYLTPARNDTVLLDTVYQNVNEYRLHFEFMLAEFPDRFGGMNETEYQQLVSLRDTRQYYAGALFQFRDARGVPHYGFNIYTDPGEPPGQDEVQSVYEQLSETMRLRPFAYSPFMPENIERASQWDNPSFPIYLPSGLTEPEYEVYSPATNYGRVRLFTLRAFTRAMEYGEIGWQDIVVIDSAPPDINTVVAGVITGTRQGELSHVNVRSLRRGTPNAYVKDALQAFASYEGQLVKLVLDGEEYSVTAPVETEDAQTWWNEHRPQLPTLPEADDTFRDIVPLPTLAEVGDDVLLRRRFGGKATGLALLYSFLDDAYQVEGFAIPFSYYVEFMQTNTVPNPYDPGGGRITYDAYLRQLIDDPNFQSDTAYRKRMLEDFREYARDRGDVDSQLARDILTRIYEVYGSSSIKVRFRSSSNAEDDLAFNGAGLYESTSVCAEDNLDDDDDGPSHCDPDQDNERTIERGLKKVWTSLWAPKAFEEREYYQIDHTTVRMGVLVTRAFPNEDANGVAFTGDPVAGHKDYFVVNVQYGDASVVQPDTGAIPEKDIVVMSEFGLEEIRRVRGSSLLPAGEWVLDATQLELLGRVLARIENEMPVDLGEYSRDQVVMDVEFKFDRGALYIKQVRPALMRATSQPEESVVLRVPQGVYAAGVFSEGRSLRNEYNVLSMVHFKSSDHTLPITPGSYSVDLIESLELGPERTLLAPVEVGRVTGEFPQWDPSQFDYTIEQTFRSDQELFVATIRFLSVRIDSGRPSPEVLLFDQDFVNKTLYMTGSVVGGFYSDNVRYSSPTHEELPLYVIDMPFDNGERIRLYQRWQEPMAGSGPASLVFADVDLLEGYVQQDDYWHLVYAAEHHNWNEGYWVLFDEPLGDTYGVAVETEESPLRRDAYTLDANLQRLRTIGTSEAPKIRTDHVPVAVGDWLLH